MTKENSYCSAVDEKIRYYATRYKNGKATAEEIKILVRLLYEEKKEKNKAVWILNQCMGQTEDTSLQLLYLYEALRVFRFFNDVIYEKYETALYGKLEQLAKKEIVYSYALLSTLYSCMEDAVRRKDFTCYRFLEQNWKSCWKNDPIWKKRFANLKKEVKNRLLFIQPLSAYWNRGNHNKNSKIKGLFVGFLVSCMIMVLVICMTMPTIHTYFRQQKEAVYLENHNMLLTEKELSKMEKLEQKYARSEYSIQYFQLVEGEKVKSVDAKKAICLFLKT